MARDYKDFAHLQLVVTLSTKTPNSSMVQHIPAAIYNHPGYRALQSRHESLA
jgi:hypothetical protein